MPRPLHIISKHLSHLCVKPHKTYPIDVKSSSNHSGEHTVVPPPQCTYVEPRPNFKKSLNLNSPQKILFAIQRKTAEFPQNIFLHLVTLFSVCSRLLPFSELLFQKFQTPRSFQPLSSWPLFQLILVVLLLRDHSLILFYPLPVLL
jgi:hypothetical protein